MQAQQKTITYWLRVNWKDETISARKTEPDRSELSPYELVVESEIQINKPAVEVPKLAAELDVPEPRIRRIVAEGLDADVDDPDWFRTVDEVLDSNPDLIEKDDPNAAALLVLKEDPGSPPVEAVMDRVREQMRKMRSPPGEH